MLQLLLDELEVELVTAVEDALEVVVVLARVVGFLQETP